MNYTVAVLCRPEVAAGFGLAGLAPRDAPDGAAAEQHLAELLADPGVGVVLAQQRLYDELPADTKRRLARRPLPLVVPFPDPGWMTGRDAAEAYIVELLRQVVGYRVRLR